MKNVKYFSLILIFMIGTLSLQAQSEEDKTGLLGDNFSLEGALEAFKSSSSMEDFEAQINSEDKSINNLDLNDNEEIDYIRVEDFRDNDVHAIVLQAIISENEVQDIAVIEIEKDGEESATLQIVGDEYLYGENVYVEPFEEVGNSDGRGGPSANYRVTRIIVNVWGWPSVRFIYRPNYVVYRSPFRWANYPRAWRPWRPVSWTVYHGRRYHYQHNCRIVNTHRVARARTVYAPKRRSSSVVVKKSKTVTRVRRNSNGNTVVKRNTKTTKVKSNRNGTVSKTKTKKSTKAKNGKVTKKTRKVKKKRGN